MSEQRSFQEDTPRFHSMQITAAATVPMLPRAAPIASKTRPSARHTNQTYPEPTSGWTVGSLAPLPTIYVLERTHIHVDDTAANVAGRIARCLQNESIKANFDEACADAETEENTQFTVRLWNGNNGQVLVEVRKISGCCFSFCQAAKAVLRAAKGVPAAPKRRTFSIPPYIPRAEPEECDAATRESLDICSDLLKQPRLDARLMAMESLVHLSRASENQVHNARCILSTEFYPTLLCLVSSDPSDSGACTDDVEKEYYRLSRRCAFAVLANCLASLHQAGELADFLNRQQDLCSGEVLISLINEIGAAPKRPHDACHAVRCLHNILSNSPESKRREAEDLGAIELISRANRMGACRHAALEDACSKLRTLL